MAYIRPDEFGYASYDSLGRMLAKSTFVDESAIYALGGYDATSSVVPNSTTHPDIYAKLSGRLKKGKITVSAAVPLSAPYMGLGGHGSAMIGMTQGLNYIEPGKVLLNSVPSIFAGNTFSESRTYVNGININKQQAHVTCYSSAEAGALSPSEYGGIVTNNEQQVVMSDELIPMYVQPMANGQRIRMAMTEQIGATTTPGNYSPSPNIIFDKPYDEPPLIFILPGSVPVALWTMNKDSNGKFVSATVVGGYIMDNSSVRATQYVGGSFSYVIATNEIPTLFDDNPSAFVDQDYGMQFFNEDGDVTYDSRYETCYASALPANVGTVSNWKYIPGIGSNNIATRIGFGQAALPSKRKFGGVALNSTNAFTGFTWACYQHTTVNGTAAYGGTQMMLGVFTDGADLITRVTTSHERGMFFTAQGINLNFNDYKREVIVAFLTDEYYQYERKMSFNSSGKWFAAAGQIKSPENKMLFGQSLTPLMSTSASLYTLSKALKVPVTSFITTRVSQIQTNIPPKSGQLETDNGATDYNQRLTSFLNIGMQSSNRLSVFEAYDSQADRDDVDLYLELIRAGNLGGGFSTTVFASANLYDGQSSALYVNVTTSANITSTARVSP